MGQKYGPEYERYLDHKLGKVNWIHEEERPFLRQWNKLRFFELDLDEPICVIDIDIELVNDYEQLFNFPCARGEFISIPAWWKDTDNPDYKLNGGFYKFWPRDTRYITEVFRNDPEKWSTHYVRNGTTIGPINGEQYFVEDHVKQRLDLKLVPEEWVQRGIEGKHLNDGEVKLIHHSFRQENSKMSYLQQF